jgi:hypothetical protein
LRRSIRASGTTAAAPSEIDEALAAVIVLSFLNAGLSPGILSELGLEWLFVLVDPGLSAFACDGDRCDLHAKLPSVLAFSDARSSDRKPVLRLARKSSILTHCFGKTPIALPRS